MQLTQMENMIEANKSPINSANHEDNYTDQKQSGVVERNKVIINQTKQ